MDLRVVFLGVGARAPTAERGVSATVVCRGPEHLLVDCGEGAQRQMMRSTAGLRHLTTILITHCHGDHVLGLPGLLATFSEVRREPLEVMGPPGVAALVEGFRPYFGELAFPLAVREVCPGAAEARDGYVLQALAARHGTPSLGWLLREDERPGRLDDARAAVLGVPEAPERASLASGADVTLPGGRRVRAGDVVGRPRAGRRIVFSGDTLPAPAIAAAAAGAELLIHDATFLERDAALARRTGHSTAAEAARVAAEADVGMLALTHRSERYAGEEMLLEARAIFPRTVAPADFDVIEIPLPERGAPRLTAGAALARG